MNEPKSGQFTLSPCWGTAEMNASHAENQETSEVLSKKPEVDRNIALHTAPAAMKSTFLISAIPVHSIPFFDYSFSLSHIPRR